MQSMSITFARRVPMPITFVRCVLCPLIYAQHALWLYAVATLVWPRLGAVALALPSLLLVAVCLLPTVEWLRVGTTVAVDDGVRGVRVIEHASKVSCLPDFLAGLTLWPCLLLTGDALTEKGKPTIELKHERIHLAQQAECSVLPFHHMYVAESLARLAIGQGWGFYESLSFEQEAYTHEKKARYASTRERFVWWGLLCNDQQAPAGLLPAWTFFLVFWPLLVGLALFPLPLAAPLACAYHLVVGRRPRDEESADPAPPPRAEAARRPAKSPPRRRRAVSITC